MRPALLLLLALPAFAQSYSVAFQPQGVAALRALTGKKVPGVGVLAVSVCSAAPLTISSKRVEQVAAEQGMSIIDPAVADQVVARARQLNAKQIALDIGGALSGIGAALMTTGAITAPPEVSAGLAIFALAARPFAALLRDRLPDPAWQRLLLSGSLQVPANGCASGLVLWLYRPGEPRVVRVADGDSGLSAVRLRADGAVWAE